MRIGELGVATGTKVETIRYYEQTGLLPPPERTAANYRQYGPDHLARLSFVRRARDLGFSIDQVRALLDLSDDRNRDCGTVDAIPTAHLREVDRKIKLLDRLTACFTDRRSTDRVQHPLAAMLAQRIFGLALGYEDLNEHEQLRSDPLFGVLSGRRELG